jgi:uncharacterized delta-60 repeat protein
LPIKEKRKMRKVVSGVMLTLLFLASLTPMFSVQLVNAEEELPIVWEAVYDEGKSEFFSNVAVDSNGNLIAVGNVLNYSTGEVAGIVAKYNGAGELLWLEKLQPYPFTNLNGIAVDSNNNIVAFGVTSTNPDMQDYGGSEIAEWLIAKFYPNGTLMWQTYYRKEGMGYHREGMYGIVAYDDSIICTGVAGYQFRVIKLDSDGNLLWETQPSIGAQGTGMAIDKNGDILVVGQTSLYPESDVVLVKLSQSGVELWSRVFDWGGNEVGKDIAIDEGGNIIIVGGSPIFMLKLNSNGNVIWKREYSRDGMEVLNVLVLPNRYAMSAWSASVRYYVEYDVDGNLFYEATFKGGTISIDTLGRLMSASSIGTWPDINATLTVYNYSAKALLIAKEMIYDEGASEYFQSAIIDSVGNIVVVGAVYNVSTGEQWILIVKYSPDGAILWSKKLNPYYRTMPGTVAVDSNDNIVVFTATSTNADFQDYGGNHIAEWMIVKFTPNGEMLWQTFYRKEGMGYHREGGWGIATYNGQIFATGCAGYGFWVISLDSNGTLLWEKQLGGWGAHGHGITVDKDGDIIVVGQTSIYSPTDVLLAKLSQSGDTIWSKVLDWGGNEGGREIAVDVDNNIVFVGEGNPPFIVKVNTDGELIWKREYLRVNIDRAWHLQVWPSQYAISVFSDAGQSPPYYVEYDYQGNMVFEAIFKGGSLSNDKYGRLISASMVGVWPTNVNATLTVYNYPPYQLTITSTIGGTTNPGPATYHYHSGGSANVKAIPYIGYSFNYWLLNGNVRTENPITVIMDSSHTLSAYFVDDIPPEISEPWQDPPANNVQPLQNVTVYVNVTDYGTGIKNVTLWYSIDNGTSWSILNMTELPIPSDMWITYEATIKGYENCTWVTYKIIAYDNAGNNATKDNNRYGYQYHVIPEFPTTPILILLMLTTILTKTLWKKEKSQPP